MFVVCNMTAYQFLLFLMSAHFKLGNITTCWFNVLLTALNSVFAPFQCWHSTHCVWKNREKPLFLKKSLSMCAPGLSSNLFHLSLETGLCSDHLSYWDIQLRWVGNHLQGIQSLWVTTTAGLATLLLSDLRLKLLVCSTTSSNMRY